MTGTIKHGKKTGQSVDVSLSRSREELEVLEAVIAAKYRNSMSLSSLFACGSKKSPSITIWTALCLPFLEFIRSTWERSLGTMFLLTTQKKAGSMQNSCFSLSYSSVPIPDYNFYPWNNSNLLVSDSWYKEITDLALHKGCIRSQFCPKRIIWICQS